MTKEQQTAIREAESTLEKERQDSLRESIYQFLKQEYDTLESLDERIRELQEKKHVHEENIKNVKAGNLEAIQKRKASLPQTYTYTIPASWLQLFNRYPMTTGTTTVWYNNNVAGTVVTTSSGRTYTF